MLNVYFGAAVPVVAEAKGGEIDRVMGDAIMAVVQPARGPARPRASARCRAAVAVRDATEAVASRATRAGRGSGSA